MKTKEEAKEERKREDDEPVGDAALLKKVDEWFAKCDADKDGKLSLAEATEYVKQWIEE